MILYHLGIAEGKGKDEAVGRIAERIARRDRARRKPPKTPRLPQ